MRKLFASTILTAVFIALPLFPVSAGAEQGDEALSFEDFEFEEYRAIISAIAETEEYPHLLIENVRRYEDYQAANPDMPFDIVIAYVNVNIDIGHYNDIQPVANPGKITALVNKNFALPSDWTADEFVNIGGGHMMHEEAAVHFNQMRDAMREANLNLNIIITYRSYNSQRNHFRNAVARIGRASAEAGFALPGHSEHQTGLAVDVLHRGHDGGLMVNMGFESSRQFEWLVENAHEYGFILRYPRGYRNISGFIFEPWHWRYVGVSIATAMFDEEIALYEEFYGRYLAQGIVDKVNAYILEQQALAEAAEAAAAEAAAAEAAAEAAAVAEAEAAAVAAAELAAAEAAAELAAEIIAATEAAVAELAAEIEAIKAREHEIASGNRHFLEVLSFIVILGALTVLFMRKKKTR